MLSFSLSVHDRDFIRDSKEPYQIMPVQRGFLTNNTIETYHKANEPHNNILIHTSYMTRVFSPIAFSYNSKIQALLRQYIKLAERIGTKYILVHGPSSENEMLNFELGLSTMKRILEEEKTKVSFYVEIPSLTKDLLAKHKDKYLEFFTDYIQTIINAGFEFIPDTAHTFNNGLTNEEVLELLNKFDKHWSWVHLNGNLRPRFTSDTHCTMFDKKNLIPEYIDFCKKIASFKRNCVCEIVYRNYDEWKEFSKEISLPLISKDAFLNL